MISCIFLERSVTLFALIDWIFGFLWLIFTMVAETGCVKNLERYRVTTLIDIFPTSVTLAAPAARAKHQVGWEFAPLPAGGLDGCEGAGMKVVALQSRHSQPYAPKAASLSQVTVNESIFFFARSSPITRHIKPFSFFSYIRQIFVCELGHRLMLFFLLGPR